MSDLTISEARAWAGAQQAVHAALRAGDRAQIDAAQTDLEELRQQLYEGDE